MAVIDEMIGRDAAMTVAMCIMQPGGTVIDRCANDGSVLMTRQFVPETDDGRYAEPVRKKGSASSCVDTGLASSAQVVEAGEVRREGIHHRWPRHRADHRHGGAKNGDGYDQRARSSYYLYRKAKGTSKWLPLSDRQGWMRYRRGLDGLRSLCGRSRFSTSRTGSNAQEGRTALVQAWRSTASPRKRELVLRAPRCRYRRGWSASAASDAWSASAIVTDRRHHRPFSTPNC